MIFTYPFDSAGQNRIQDLKEPCDAAKVSIKSFQGLVFVEFNRVKGNKTRSILGANKSGLLRIQIFQLRGNETLKNIGKPFDIKCTFNNIHSGMNQLKLMHGDLGSREMTDEDCFTILLTDACSTDV